MVAATDITLRAATPDDVAILIPLVNDAYRKSEGHVFPESTRIERGDLLARVDSVVVAEIDGRVAGCMQFELHDDYAHFGLLSVHVGLQGTGVGSRLIEHAELVARAAGCSVMRIEVVKEGGRVPYYERRGYRVTAETPGQQWNGGADWGAAIDWHMVDMEKAL